MAFFFFLQVRLRTWLGETAYVESLSGSSLHTFISATKRCIVVYCDPTNETRHLQRYMNPTISLYKEYLDFAFGVIADAPREICRVFPCSVGYRSGAPIAAEQPPNTTSGFLNWVDRVSHPRIRPVVSVNHLNDLLNGPTSVLFGVDLQEKPKHAPKGEVIYLIASDLFRVFNVTASRGLYAYRPIDRELTAVNLSNFGSAFVNRIVSFESILKGPRQKKLVGFALDQSNSSLCSLHFSILRNLTSEFPEFEYTVINGTDFKQFCLFTRIESFEGPFFFVVDLTNPTRKRWITTEISDIPRFLRGVISGDERPIILSEPVPDDSNETVKRLVGSTFIDDVFEDTREAVVVFTRENCSRFKFFKPIVEAVAALVKSRATFLYIDVSRNDVPETVPDTKQCPSMILWPRGNKTDPVVYKGNGTFIDVLNFVRDNAGRTLRVRKFDIDVVKKRLAAVIKQIRFG
jgi:hypothetical protein